MKYLLDANVYFAAFRSDRSFDLVAASLARIMPQVWLCSVVFYELLAGARGDVGRATVVQLMKPLVRARRVVAPNDVDWAQAGIVQSRIWDSSPSLRTKRLQNDVLIARCALRIGAVVVTENTRDFATIAPHVPHTSLRTRDLDP